MNNNVVDRETLELAIEALEGQQRAIQSKLDRLREALTQKEGSQPSKAENSGYAHVAKRPKRTISKAGIEAIRKAQKARWAAIKAQQVKKAGKKATPAKKAASAAAAKVGG